MAQRLHAEWQAQRPWVLRDPERAAVAQHIERVHVGGWCALLPRCQGLALLPGDLQSIRNNAGHSMTHSQCHGQPFAQPRWSFHAARWRRQAAGGKRGLGQRPFGRCGVQHAPERCLHQRSWLATQQRRFALCFVFLAAARCPRTPGAVATITVQALQTGEPGVCTSVHRHPAFAIAAAP